MTFFWIIVIIIVVWWLAKNHSKTNSDNEVESKLSTISEEVVFTAQNKFEKNLENTNLPDAVTHRDLYVYRNLMRDWYTQLVGKNRYDDVMIQKLRNDWLDYMEALGDRNTYNFLSLESEGQESDDYREKHIISSRKAAAIQDAFAAAIGNEAAEELARVEKMSFSAFNASGELAPDGYEYDLLGKLKKLN